MISSPLFSAILLRHLVSTADADPHSIEVPKKLLTQADESAKKLRRLNNATRHACCEARKSPRLPLELAGHPLHGPCLQAQKGAFLIPALLRFPRFANMATEVLKISDGTTMDTRRATAIGDIMLRDGCRLVDSHNRAGAGGCLSMRDDRRGL